MKTVIRHDDWLMAKLADLDFSAEYLNAAGEDDDPKTYLTAMRKVVEARGGMASVAESADLSRETLCRSHRASEVLREGLRLIELREAEDKLRLTVLKKAARLGIADINAGAYDSCWGANSQHRFQ
jgi:DNA-binding phage protein